MAADFDGPEAMFDALMYVKAGRALQVPVALEVSRSGVRAQRMRASTWNIPRFLHAYDETLDGGLVLPRGMLDTVTSLAAQAGSRLEVTDEHTPGMEREFTDHEAGLMQRRFLL